MECLDALGPLGMGAAPIGNFLSTLSDDAASETIRAAFAEGVRHFDTAPHYGFGLTEKRLGAVLCESDPGGRAIISTKVGRRLDFSSDAPLSALRQGYVSPEPFESVFDYGYDAVLRSFEESLKRLRRTRIDILYAHDLGRVVHRDHHAARFREFMEGGYRAMRQLRESGAVRAIGLGVNEWQVCEEALAHGDFDVMLLAGRYTLLEQSALATFFPLCAARNVRVVVGGPLNSGVLARGSEARGPARYNYQDAPPAILAKVDRLEATCARHGVPLMAAALQFPLAHPQVACVAAGFRGASQAREAVRMAALALPRALWDDLRAEGLLAPDAPTPDETGRET